MKEPVAFMKHTEGSNLKIISNTSRGPSCFSNSSRGNGLRHPNHEAHAGDTPLSAGRQPGQIYTDWLVRNSSEFSLVVWGTIWQEYANCLYVAVEIPECWATPALKGRERARVRWKKKGEWGQHALLLKASPQLSKVKRDGRQLLQTSFLLASVYFFIPWVLQGKNHWGVLRVLRFLPKWRMSC